MANIYTLTADDSRVGGVLVLFDTGHKVTASWVREAPVSDTRQAGQAVAARVLDELLRDGRIREADGTNWPSVAAAVGAVVGAWSDVRRAALYAAVDPGLSLVPRDA